MESITPDVVRKFTSPTEKFLCGRSANIYNIKFKKFRMRDLDSGFVLFEVADDSPEPEKEAVRHAGYGEPGAKICGLPQQGRDPPRNLHRGGGFRAGCLQAGTGQRVSGHHPGARQNPQLPQGGIQ